MSDPFKFVSLDELRASPSPIVDVITADQIQNIAILDCGGPLTEEELGMFVTAGQVQSCGDFDAWLHDVIQTSRALVDEWRGEERRVDALVKQGHAANEIAKTLGRLDSHVKKLIESAESRQRMILGSTYPLEAFVSQQEVCPAPAQLIAAVLEADIVMGIDIATGERFVVYGQEALDDITRMTQMGGARVIWIEVSQKSQIPRLCALVQRVKGRHDYRCERAA